MPYHGVTWSEFKQCALRPGVEPSSWATLVSNACWQATGDRPRPGATLCTPLPANPSDMIACLHALLDGGLDDVQADQPRSYGPASRAVRPQPRSYGQEAGRDVLRAIATSDYPHPLLLWLGGPGDQVDQETAIALALGCVIESRGVPDRILATSQIRGHRWRSAYVPRWIAWTDAPAVVRCVVSLWDPADWPKLLG